MKQLIQQNGIVYEVLPADPYGADPCKLCDLCSSGKCMLKTLSGRCNGNFMFKRIGVRLFYLSEYERR